MKALKDTSRTISLVLAALACAVGSASAGVDGVFVAGTRALDGEPALLEYSLSGTLVDEILVEPPSGIEDITPRDVAVDRLGNVHMMVAHAGSNGNLSLCTYTGSGWTQISVPDWWLGGVTYYGGIGVNDDYLYCPDQDGGGDDTVGILRFPINDLAAYQHFPTGEFHTITVGLNGLVYGADRNGNCWIFHPVTMERLADLGFGKLRRGDSVVDVCVGPDGDIFTIDLGGDLNHFDPFGNFIAEVGDVGPGGDIEVRADGTLVIGLADQRVLVGTTALSGFTEFSTNYVYDPAGQIRNHLCFSTYAALPVPAPPRAAIAGLEVSEGGVNIRFRRLPGVQYELWNSGNLSTWDKLPTEVSGTGVDGVFAFGPTGGVTSNYFRIVSRLSRQQEALVP